MWTDWYIMTKENCDSYNKTESKYIAKVYPGLNPLSVWVLRLYSLYKQSSDPQIMDLVILKIVKKTNLDKCRDESSKWGWSSCAGPTSVLTVWWSDD